MVLGYKRGLGLPDVRFFIGPGQTWKRLLALVIDLLIIDFFLLSPFRGTVLAFIGSGSQTFAESYSFFTQRPALTDAFALLFFIFSLFMFSYFVLFEYLIGQTPGKIFLKLFVVNREEFSNGGDLKKLSLFQSIVRSLFVIPFFPFVILWIVDPLMLFIDKNHQRLMEKLSHTQVVERFHY